MDSTPTQLQRAFAVELVAGGGNVTQAAIRAGYSPASARQIGQHLLEKPHVQAAIRMEQGRVLGRLAVKAMCLLEGVMDDPNAPAGARVDAAKTILDRAGFPAIPAKALARGGLSDAPAEMSREELRAFIAQGRAALAQHEAEEAEASGDGAGALPALEHHDHTEL